MRTVAHISDIHFGKIDLRIANALETKLSELDPSLTIISGDLTQRARAWQFQAAADYLRRLPRPQLVVPGNHDVPLYDVARRWFAPTQLYQRYITPNLTPVFEDEQLLVVGINTARAFSPRVKGFWKDGRIDARQLAAIRPLFSAAKPGQTKILVTHHPFIPAPGRDPNDLIHGASMAMPVLAELKIDLLLAGHLHRGYGGDVRTHHPSVVSPLLSIQAGTATSTRLRDAPNAFNFFRIEPERIELVVHHWDGVTFKADERQLFSRHADGWHAEQH